MTQVQPPPPSNTDGAAPLPAPSGSIRLAASTPLAELAGVAGLEQVLSGCTFGEAATLAGLVDGSTTDELVVAALLVCEPVVTCDSPGGRFDQPLPAVLGRALPATIVVESMLLTTEGSFGVGRGDPIGGAQPAVAVARRTIDGRTMRAVAGIAPVPLIVADPRFLPTPPGEDGEARRAAASDALRRAETAAGRHRQRPPLVRPPVVSRVLSAAEVPRLAVVGVDLGERPRPAPIAEPIAFDRFDLAPDEPLGGWSGASFEGESTVVHPLSPFAADGDGTGVDDTDASGELRRTALELDRPAVRRAPLIAEAWSSVDGRLHLRTATTQPYAVRAELARRLHAPAAAIRVVASHATERPVEVAQWAMLVELARRSWETGRAWRLELDGDGEPAGADRRQRVEVVSEHGPGGWLAHLVSTVVASPPPDAGGDRHSAELARSIAVGSHLGAIARTLDAADLRLLEWFVTAEPALDGRQDVLRRAWAATTDGTATAPVPIEDGRRRGNGSGIAVDRRSARGATVGASVSLTEDGSLLAAISVADVHGRLADALRRVVAEVFATELDDVVLTLGDTDRVAGHDGIDGHGGFATAARAIKRAADQLRTAAARRAAAALELDDWRMVEIAGRRAVGTDRRQVALAELAGSTADGSILLVGHGQAAGDEQPTSSTATAAVSVLIDVDSGEIELERLALAIDAGVIVDPQRAAAAVREGAADALGWLLDGARAVVPDVTFVESLDDGAPFGARSLPDPTAAIAIALLDAVEEAIGVRPDRLPLRPEHLLAEIERIDSSR